MYTTEELQKIQLIDGEYRPSEASDLVRTLIDENINVQKVHRLSMRIHDETAPTSSIDRNISRLRYEKQTAREFIAEARHRGCRVRVNGFLELSIED